jgi:hypothetical protein
MFKVMQRAERGTTMGGANKRDGKAVKAKGRRYTSKKGRKKLFHLFHLMRYALAVKPALGPGAHSASNRSEYQEVEK